MPDILSGFDKSKPFYPLVVNYAIQLLGMKEIVLRAAIGSPERTEEYLLDRVGRRGLDESALTDNELRSLIRETLGSIKKISGPLELRSEYLNDRLTITEAEISKDLVGPDHSEQMRFSLRSATGILIIAHEITKDEPCHDSGPLWEFLRHCRNAAAHNGLFHFFAGEPRRPATWGHMSITAALQGTPLMKDSLKQGFLSPGDPIQLLFDIEQAYPAIGT